MKTDNHSCHFPMVILLLLLWGSILLVSIGSWIGHLYGFPFKSVLSVDGVRWVLCSVPHTFMNSPLADLVVLSMGWGLAEYSGFFSAVRVLLGIHAPSDKRGYLSLRGRRGIMLSFVALLFYLFILSFGIWGSNSALLSVLGGWEHSAFLRGIWALLSIGLGVVGIIYGYSMGRFSFHQGLLEGLSSTLYQIAPAIVVLFFSCQLFNLMDYCGISDWCGFSSDTCLRQWVETVIYYFPFIYYIIVSDKH